MAHGLFGLFIISAVMTYPILAIAPLSLYALYIVYILISISNKEKELQKIKANTARIRRGL